MNITEKIGIHNRFDIEVIDARTGKVKQKAQAFNVILDRLWSQMCSATGLYFTHIFYGSGTGTPSHTDSTLFHHVASVQITGDWDKNSVNKDYENNVVSLMRSIQLSETTAVGVNLTEVGIGYGTAAANLCTHAMLQDMNGNPISILKTNTDIINIYATVYIHWSNHSAFSPYFEWDGTHYYSTSYSSNSLYKTLFGLSKATNVVSTWMPGMTGGKECLPNSYFDDSYVRNVTALAGAGTPLVDKGVSLAYDSANKKIVGTYARIPIAKGNIGGIGILCLTQANEVTIPMVELNVSSFYEGTQITGEAIGTGDGSTVKFETKFDFPENAKILVDGVEQTSGVTVRNIPRATYALGNYIRVLRGGSTHGYPQTASATLQNSSTDFSIGANVTIFNKANEVGFASIVNTGAGRILGSNNLSDWTELAEPSAGTVVLEGSDQHYKYYKNTGSASATLKWNTNDGKAIVFDTAPANGAVITANYKTPYIAKDEDHVLDITVTWQFGEWSE